MPVRTLEKHAYIMQFVVAYKCSDCGMIFKVPVQRHITGNISGPPKQVLDDFANHTCAPPATDQATTSEGEG